MKRHTRGFYTVEAALILPLVLLAVLSVSFLSSVYRIHERAFHCLWDECRLAAAEAYGEGAASPPLRELEERLAGDCPGLEGVSLKGEQERNGLTQVSLQGSVRLDLPPGFGRDISLECRVLFRGFTGKREESRPGTVEELERSTPGDPVTVFPSSGVKYHSRSCTYVSASASPEILSPALRRKYSPCLLCSPEDIETGSTVFCFRKSGSAYHRSSCSTLSRKTVTMDRSDAVKRGYLPCSRCGGGD